MRKISFFYFIPNDLKFILSKRKRELFISSSLFIAGIITGILIALNAESEYTGAFMLIVSNNFSPLKSLGLYFLLLAVASILSYLSAWKKPIVLLLTFWIFFIGYIFGRMSCFSIMNNAAYGVISLILFIAPNAFVVFFETWLIFAIMREETVCVLSLKRNIKQIKKCVNVLILALILLFIVNVIIGGLINLMINVV